MSLLKGKGTLRGEATGFLFKPTKLGVLNVFLQLGSWSLQQLWGWPCVPFFWGTHIATPRVAGTPPRQAAAVKPMPHKP